MAASTTNKSPAEHINEHITCPICLDLFADPRLLPCSHTICYKCIQEMARVTGKFTCPLRDGTEVSKEAIRGLPLNRIVKNIVDSLKSNPLPVPQPWPNNLENKEILDLSLHSSLARGGERYRDFHSTAYGYQFQLGEPIRLSSVEVKVDVDGPVTVAITNAATTKIQQSTVVSTAGLKWLKIPIIVEIKNQFRILVYAEDKNGDFAYKQMKRMDPYSINRICSVIGIYLVQPHDRDTNEFFGYQCFHSMEMHIEVER